MRSTLLIRLAIGTIQAGALYVLIGPRAAGYAPLLFAPLIMLAILLPISLSLGLSQFQGWHRGRWTLIATLFIAGVAYHDIAGGAVPAVSGHGASWTGFRISPALIVGLFIGQIMLADGLRQRRWFPDYPVHFDTAWKQALQIALGAAFVGAFWLVLELGAALGLFNNYRFRSRCRTSPKPLF